MKKTLILLINTFLLSFILNGQTVENNYDQKVKTLDSTIKTLYNVISGEAGVKRDWELFKFLFTKDAKLIPSGKNKEGKVSYKYMTPDDYIKTSGTWLEENGFFEKEIGRKTETFGNMAHVFSTYEAYKSASDQEPFMSGINSIQLIFDGNRWLIINIYWTGETKENPIPKKYLKLK